MFAFALALFSLVASAFATVYMTSPTAQTVCKGGSTCQINWEETPGNNTAPTLAQFGNASVAIYTGNSQQQTMLQPIVDSVNVATTNAISFTVDPSIGPNGKLYFIRFTSQVFKDPTSSYGFLEEAFSSLFTLAEMTGTFNATVQAEVNGASTAPIGGSTSAPSSTVAPPSGFSTTVAQPSTTSSSLNTTASSSNSTSGAERMLIPGGVSLVGFAAFALTFAL